MNARILGPEEFARLEMETEKVPILPYTLPRNMAVVVVEEDGEIVGKLQVAQISHFEGLWIKPEFRGNAGVMRSLLRLAVALPQARGECWVLGGAADPRMQDFSERLGGQKLQMDFYALWVGGETCPQQ